MLLTLAVELDYSYESGAPHRTAGFGGDLELDSVHLATAGLPDGT
jgi:hypothetical protein